MFKQWQRSSLFLSMKTDKQFVILVAFSLIGIKIINQVLLLVSSYLSSSKVICHFFDKILDDEYELSSAMTFNVWSNLCIMIPIRFLMS